ncbi:hypothetical protein MRB53_037616 [Persea americana]|nr:hypothetical protein MRB53_037616 [Persea americana]
MAGSDVGLGVLHQPREFWVSAFMSHADQLQVRRHVAQYNIAHPSENSEAQTSVDGFGVDTAYDKLDGEDMLRFWGKHDVLTIDVFTQMMTCLKKNVDIQAVWDKPEWNDYFRGVFCIAADSTWESHEESRGRFRNGRRDVLQISKQSVSPQEAMAGADVGARLSSSDS